MNSDQLRIIHAVPTWLARTEVWLHGLITSLDEYVQNYVVCEDFGNVADEYPREHLHVFSRDAPRRLRANRVLQRLKVPFRFDFLSRCIKDIRPQIVHSHFGKTGIRNSRTARKHGVKHVVTFYGYDVSLLPRQRPEIIPAYQKMFQNTDLVLAEGSSMAGQIERLGCPPERIQVQHLGVPVDRFAFKPRSWMPGEQLKVLMAGRFVEKKGFPIAIQALARVAAQLPIKITLIGDASPQPRFQKEKALILKAIEENNLQDCTELRGFCPYSQLIEAGYEHHLFLSPSVTSSDGDNEGGLPVTIIEFAATGMPIVGTTHCDIPEVVTDGETGWLAPERDVAALADKILEAVDARDKWPKMLAKLREHVEREYDHSRQARRLVDIYQRLL